MGSDLALRLYTIATNLKEPLPQFSEDDVLDFMVKEAVMLRGLKQRKDQQAAHQREQWKHAPVGSGTPRRSV